MRRVSSTSAGRMYAPTVGSAPMATGPFSARLPGIGVGAVAPEAAGRVVETPVNVGDFVKQGQVLARLENRDAQLRLDQAKAAANS